MKRRQNRKKIVLSKMVYNSYSYFFAQHLHLTFQKELTILAKILFDRDLTLEMGLL